MCAVSKHPFLSLYFSLSLSHGSSKTSSKNSIDEKVQMKEFNLLLLCSASLILLALLGSHKAAGSAGLDGGNGSAVPVDVGVILDLDTNAGKRSRTSISMALEDFYASHGEYKTKLVPHFRDSQQDAIGAAAAAVDLLKNVQVKSIVGPSTSTEADFVIYLGNKTQVPIVSFSATSPFLSSAAAPYFVRTTLNDSSQVAAIAAVISHFGWREVVLIYEDSEYGRGVIPYLIDALQAVNSRVPYRSVISTSATDDQLDEELYKLVTMQTRVFIVHTFPDLGSRLFQRAKEIGAMGQGYAWIITDGIADVLDKLDPAAADAMEGVIGVRPYVNMSTQEIRNFSARFTARFLQDYPEAGPTRPSVYELWAYDTVWALAMAINEAELVSSSTQPPVSSGDNSTDLGQLRVVQNGPGLLDAIFKIRFKGLAGDFELVNGQLQSSAFEIVNVHVPGWRTIGFWTPENRLSKTLNSSAVAGLKSVIWPGDSMEVPKGWEIPTTGKKLRVGLPVKYGFEEFVKLVRDPVTNRTEATGFCIDVFEAVLQNLSYAVPYEYVPFGDSSSSYDNLVYQVYLKNLDVVVGDVTIIANRSQYVDFTMPYTESGVSLVVLVKEDSKKNAWIFLKPLTTGLWLGSLAFFVLTGFVVWLIEHRDNDEFKGTLSEQIGIIFYFTFSILVFSHKEKLTSNLTRFLVIIWVFVVLVLTSSYTASLTSMLTVQQLRPKVSELDDLLHSKAYVGYQDGSFVKNLLKGLKFPEDRLRNYSTMDQYADALSKGSDNGGVDAIFDEIPYLKLFLSNNCDGFAMVGRTYKTDGFGFVFPLGSPLAPDVSRGVLNVMEGEKMTLIENKWFGTMTCPSQSNDLSSSSLSFDSFEGLFLITGVVSVVSLLISLVIFSYNEWDNLKKASSMDKSLSKKIVSWVRYYHDPDSRKEKIQDVDEESQRDGEWVDVAGGLPISVSLSDHSDLITALPFEGFSSTEPNSPLH